MTLFLTIVTTAVTLALSGVFGYATWHFNKALFALFPPPAPREDVGIIGAIIGGIFDGVSSAIDAFASIMITMCCALALTTGCIIAAATLPLWAVPLVGLALATLPITIVCGAVIGMSALYHHFGAFFRAIGAWLYRVAARFTGFVGAMLDSIALLFTNLPAFFERIAAVSERAGDNLRRAINGHA